MENNQFCEGLNRYREMIYSRTIMEIYVENMTYVLQIPKKLGTVSCHPVFLVI